MPEESRTEFIQFCDKKRICDACDTNRCVKNLRFKDFSHFSPFRRQFLICHHISPAVSPCMCGKAKLPRTVGRSPYRLKSSRSALCKHGTSFRFLLLFRRACAGKQSFPALSGIRPIA